MNQFQQIFFLLSHLEVELCKNDFLYWYKNYCLIEGKPVEVRDVDAAVDLVWGISNMIQQHNREMEPLMDKMSQIINRNL